MARLSLCDLSWGWVTMTLKLIQEAQKEVTADEAGPQGSSWSDGKEMGVSCQMGAVQVPCGPSVGLWHTGTLASLHRTLAWPSLFSRPRWVTFS